MTQKTKSFIQSMLCDKYFRAVIAARSDKRASPMEVGRRAANAMIAQLLKDRDRLRLRNVIAEPRTGAINGGTDRSSRFDLYFEMGSLQFLVEFQTTTQQYSTRKYNQLLGQTLAIKSFPNDARAYFLKITADPKVCSYWTPRGLPDSMQEDGEFGYF